MLLDHAVKRLPQALSDRDQRAYFPR